MYLYVKVYLYKHIWLDVHVGMSIKNNILPSLTA